MPGREAKKVRKLIDTANVIFRNQGRTPAELAKLLDVNEKELNRALETLSLCGLPPYGPGDLFDTYIDGGRVYIQHPYGLFERPVQFSPAEGMALLVAGRAAGAADAALASALAKIRDALKPEKARELEKLSRRMDLTPETGSIRPTLELLNRAAGAHRKVEIEYFTAGRGKMSRRVVHPYGLVYNVDRWFLVGWCEARRELRVFRADRIKSARETGGRFEPPADFDLAEFRREKRYIDRPHKARIRFGGVAAEWAAERWPGRAKTAKDGTADVEFSVDRLENFVPTVLSFGDSASVVSPPELRRFVGESAAGALRLYERKDLSTKDTKGKIKD